jgi:hypothetical protein
MASATCSVGAISFGVTQVTAAKRVWTHLSMVSDRGKSPMPTELLAKKARPEWSWSAQTRIDPDLIATVLFCAIGLLVTLIVMLSFPDLGALIEQYNQF